LAVLKHTPLDGSPPRGFSYLFARGADSHRGVTLMNSTTKMPRFHIANKGQLAIRLVILLALAAVVGVTGYASIETSIIHAM
jgi:hypothetical protein